jgi:hypothetical protein
MNGSFKNLALTAVLLSLSVSAYASAETRDILKSAGDTAAKAEDRCAGIKALSANSDEETSKQLAALVNDGDPAVQDCAIRAAGETKNAFAAEALLENVKSYHDLAGGRGPYEEHLKARLKAIKSIWSIGEIGDPKVMNKVLGFFNGSDDVVKINMAVSAGKTKAAETERFLYKLAASAAESNQVRAAAYEMLDERRAAAPAPKLSDFDSMEKGDLIYTGGVFGIPQGWIGDLEIGHVGIYGGTEIRNGRIAVVIYDCVPDNFKPYGGVRRIYSFNYFTHEHMYPFFGNRVSKVRPTPAQRDLIIKAAKAKLGHHYSDLHIYQKGPEVFDCVGYGEYAYEAAGLNPTPDDQETGLGWPLTPAEQFAATVSNNHNVPVMAAMPAHRTPEAPAQSIITGNFGALSSFLGAGAPEVPAAPADVAPVTAD